MDGYSVGQMHFFNSCCFHRAYLQLNETASKVAEVVRKIKIEFDNFDKSTEGVLKKLDSSVKEVSALQTRINVLGRELNKGAKELKEK